MSVRLRPNESDAVSPNVPGDAVCKLDARADGPAPERRTPAASPAVVVTEADPSMSRLGVALASSE